MAVKMVSSIPPVSIFKQIGTSLIRMFGALLIFIGSLSSLVVLLAVIAFISEGELSDDGESMGFLIIACLLTFVGIPLGRRMRRGRRSLVLYLRKFGFTSSTNVLTYAISTAVGKTWRLVTLDDSHTEPVSIPRGKRKFYGFARWGLTLGMIALVWRFIAWIRADSNSEEFNETFDKAYKSAQESGQGCLQAFVGAFISTAIGYIIVFVIILMLFIVAIAVLGSLTLFSWGTIRAINKAERSAAFDINSKNEIESQVKKIDRISKKIFAPRLIIAHVADSIWQKVIEEIDSVTQYIIIDVSDPTEYLLWEIRTIQRQATNQVIYVGHEPSLQFINNPVEKTDSQQGLIQLLDGQTVLTYHGQDQSSLRKFSRSLRAMLERRNK